MAIVHNTNQYQSAVNQLPIQFRDKPRFLSLLQAYMNEVQAVEDALFSIFTARLLQNSDILADDDLLDKIGKIVGQDRGGATNAEYRVLITARIQSNISDGRIEQLLTIQSLLVPSTPIYVLEFYPKSIFIQSDGINASPKQAFSLMAPAVAAGTHLMYSATTVAYGNTILFGSTTGGLPRNGGNNPTATQSFGDATQGAADGGKLAGIFDLADGSS